MTTSPTGSSFWYTDQLAHVLTDHLRHALAYTHDLNPAVDLPAELGHSVH